jgi:hypothetical protein
VDKVAKNGNISSKAAGRALSTFLVTISGRNADRKCVAYVREEHLEHVGPCNAMCCIGMLCGIVPEGHLTTALLQRYFAPTGAAATSDERLVLECL